MRTVYMLPPPEKLEAMILKWLYARPLGMSRVKNPESTVIPDELIATITSKDPWRERAIADARVWLSTPMIVGIGLRAELEPYPGVQPFEDWEHSISPIHYDVIWSQDMTGMSSDGYNDSLQRVAVEEGEWRIVEFWDEKSPGRNRGE